MDCLAANQKYGFPLTCVGMSQYGANLMAQEGKSYREILMWYYTGVKIEDANNFF